MSSPEITPKITTITVTFKPNDKEAIKTRDLSIDEVAKYLFSVIKEKGEIYLSAFERRYELLYNDPNRTFECYGHCLKAVVELGQANGIPILKSEEYCRGGLLEDTYLKGIKLFLKDQTQIKKLS